MHKGYGRHCVCYWASCYIPHLYFESQVPLAFYAALNMYCVDFVTSWWALDGQEIAMASFQEDLHVELTIHLITRSTHHWLRRTISKALLCNITADQACAGSCCILHIAWNCAGAEDTMANGDTNSTNDNTSHLPWCSRKLIGVLITPYYNADFTANENDAIGAASYHVVCEIQ